MSHASSRPYPENAEQLKNDAMALGFKPNALARTITGAEVLLTSWPWFDGEGDDQAAMIMARTDKNDPSTNQPMRYFLLMQKTGEQEL
jgi:hypothetical protein